MKQTKITYITINDKVAITGIKNVASIEELKKEFPVAIISEYIGGYPHYYTDRHNLIIKEHPPKETIKTVESELEELFSKEDFECIVRVMKQSGKRLCQLIKWHNEKIEQHKIPFIVKEPGMYNEDIVISEPKTIKI